MPQNYAKYFMFIRKLFVKTSFTKLCLVMSLHMITEKILKNQVSKNIVLKAGIAKGSRLDFAT